MKRFLGFVILLGLIVFTLQFLSWWNTKRKVHLGSPVRFESIAKLKENISKQKEREKPKPETKKVTEQKVKQPQEKPHQAKPSRMAKTKPEAKPEVTKSEPKPVPEPKIRKTEKPKVTKPAGEKKVSQGMEVKKGKIRVVTVPDEVFVEIESLQGKSDEVTDAQKKLMEKGVYNWGVLLSYENPDEAIELIGGVLVAQRVGTSNFYQIKGDGDQVYLQQIINPLAVFSSIALMSHNRRNLEKLERALRNSTLPGEVEDYRLWYLFPKKEGIYISNKVVKTFECTISSLGLEGEKADDFRKKARLRFEVVTIMRPNGGRIGCLIPKYFSYGEKKIPVPEACVSDKEWLKLKEYLRGSGNES